MARLSCASNGGVPGARLNGFAMSSNDSSSVYTIFRATGGVLCTFCLCASRAFAIASRTAVDDPTGVVLTEVGVLLPGLDVSEPLCEPLVAWRERCGDADLVGVTARAVETGVVSRDLEALNEVEV